MAAVRELEAQHVPDDRVPPRSRLASWWLWDAVLPFVATRLALLLVAWIATGVLAPAESWKPSEDDWRVNAFARGDGWWYVSIAQFGYGRDHPDGYSDVAFAPALPALIKLGDLVLRREGTDWLYRLGILVSNAAGLLAAIYLVALARREFDAALARRAAFYLLVFPTSFFLSAVYPQSLFLLAAIAAMYHARAGQWWRAGAFAVLGTLSRHQGVLLVLPLALEYALQRGWRPRRVRLDVLALGLPILAFVAWNWYLFLATGDPLAAMEAQLAWDRRLTWPWVTLQRFFSQPPAPLAFQHSLLDLSFAAGFLALVVAGWRVLPRSLAALLTLFYLPIVSSGSLSSALRFCLELFPAFLVLALAGRRPSFDRAYVAISAMLGGLLMALFAVGHWIA